MGNIIVFRPRGTLVRAALLTLTLAEQLLISIRMGRR